jgi:hypothetical protein
MVRLPLACAIVAVPSKRPVAQTVMPGLDPGIHHFAKKMDCRVKPGNDNKR